MREAEKVSKKKKISRRSFIGSAAAAGVFTIVPRHVLGGAGYKAPSEKLNIAAIGIGGKGAYDIERCAGENIVALCDVDWKYSKWVLDTYPKAARYKDYRKMFEKQKDIDAVIVATPDHSHFVITMAAMELGKHVYVQKPLARTVSEVRKLTEAAKRYNVVTQMGNQGHSGEGIRLVCEWIWDGAIGDVHEVHSWTDRPIWPHGIDRPKEEMAVPEGFEWDLWVGPAKMRPYNDAYHPARWRGWWDFGAGALGDMGCHVLDPVYWALKLGQPESVSASVSKYSQRVPDDTYGRMWDNKETFPRASVVRYKFGAREGMGPVKLTWYDGGMRPERPEEFEERRIMTPNNCSTIFVGDKGTLICGQYGDSPRLIPESAMRAYKRPAKTLERIEGGNSGHEQNWIDACKGGKAACSNFDYSGPFSEMVLLGNLAVRYPDRELKWDSKNLKVTNLPEADEYINPTYRQGW